MSKKTLTKKKTPELRNEKTVYEVTENISENYRKFKYTKAELEERKKRVKDIEAFETSEHEAKLAYYDNEISELDKLIKEIETEEGTAK